MLTIINLEVIFSLVDSVVRRIVFKDEWRHIRSFLYLISISFLFWSNLSNFPISNLSCSVFAQIRTLQLITLNRLIWNLTSMLIEAIILVVYFPFFQNTTYLIEFRLRFNVLTYYLLFHVKTFVVQIRFLLLYIHFIFVKFYPVKFLIGRHISVQ